MIIVIVVFWQSSVHLRNKIWANHNCLHARRPNSGLFKPSKNKKCILQSEIHLKTLFVHTKLKKMPTEQLKMCSLSVLVSRLLANGVWQNKLCFVVMLHVCHCRGLSSLPSTPAHFIPNRWSVQDLRLQGHKAKDNKWTESSRLLKTFHTI